MKNDLIKSFRLELDKIHNALGTISTQVGKIENRLDDLSKKQCAQGKEIDNLRSSIERIELELTDSILEEVENRYRRRQNLILSNVSEPQTGSITDSASADTQTIKDVIQELGCDPDFTNVRRIGRMTSGRPRLLCFRCNNEEAKFSLLRNAKKLRSSDKFKGVYINRDLTPLEQKQRKVLLEELKKRRESGESVVIRHNKIVPQNLAPQNFQ